MRISDWSSDVCSSDLLVETAVGRRLMSNFHGMYSLGAISGALMLTGLLTVGLAPEIGSFLMIGLIVAENLGLARGFLQIGRALCRERVCQFVLILVVAGSLKKKKDYIMSRVQL